MYRPAWSDAILEELEIHEAQKLIQRGAEPDHGAELAYSLLERMRTSFDDALVEGWEGLEGTYNLPDPDDEHVVAAAVVGEADAIVTHNIKDFPADKLPHHLELLRPAEFLRHTVSQGPHRALRAVTEIARRSGRKGPPMTVQQVRDLLTSRYELTEAVAVLRGVLGPEA